MLSRSQAAENETNSQLTAIVEPLATSLGKVHKRLMVVDSKMSVLGEERPSSRRRDNLSRR